jgi:hypothetical protein
MMRIWERPRYGFKVLKPAGFLGTRKFLVADFI